MKAITPKSTIYRIKTLKENLSSEIFGQDEAISAIVDKLMVFACGLADEEKPIGSFLFTGPTGVGKTELAKSLAKHLEMNFVRFDMSEYMSEYNANNLIGGGAGLVGYEEGGLLTNAILESPNSVLLIDEIEKADRRVLNMFLQILDYATLTSTKGQKVCFKKCIIIFTSNLGAKSSLVQTVGFGAGSYKEIEEEVDDFLLPEFRARINTHIEFNPLNENISKLIADKYLSKISQKLLVAGINLSYTDRVVNYITTLSNGGLGARNIHNIIEQTVKTTISRELIIGSTSGADLEADICEGQLVISKKTKATAPQLPQGRQGEFDFATAQEAFEYSKANIGVVITRSNCGRGFIIKK